MAYEVKAFVQDTQTGRTAEILSGLSWAASIEFDSVDAAVAYVTRSGVSRLHSELASGSWEAAGKRWLVSIDHGISEPGGLQALADLTNSEVRVPNGKRVLQDERLRPPTAFHTKAYLFRTADSASPLALMIGSANLTASALAVGAEMATVQVWTGEVTESEDEHAEAARSMRLWFDQAWDTADQLAEVLPDYTKRYKAGEGKRDDELDATKAFWNPDFANSGLAAQLAAAHALWVEVHHLYENLGPGNPGNQLDTPRGTRAFFGFASTDVPVNTTVGTVVLQVDGGFDAVTRSVRFADNSMDKVNLPVPGSDGPATYDNSFVVFVRDGQTEGLPRFRVFVETEGELQARRDAASGEAEFTMMGGRRYGLLF